MGRYLEIDAPERTSISMWFISQRNYVVRVCFIAQRRLETRDYKSIS